MTIGDIKDSLMPLLDDASEAEAYLDNNPNSQFARRTYIRSFFSCMEGVIWVLKGVCFNVKPINGKRIMSAAEFSLLKEESYELKNNGEIGISTKFLRLPDNIRFTYKIINKLFKSDIDLGVGGDSWNEFLKSIEVRNRITHPKTGNSFIISDKEIELCKRTSSWFSILTHKSLQEIIKTASLMKRKE